MVQRGARHLILLSRFGPRISTEAFLDDLKAEGVDLYIPACDITDKESLKCVLDHCAQNMPPVKGCVQASMVLKASHLPLTAGLLHS